MAGRLRTGLHEAVRGLSPPAAGLLPGLVLGDTSRLDAQIRDDFRTTGLSHLVAVSGANCAIVLGAVLGLARALGLGLRARAVCGALALGGFVVLARPSPSVLRAAAMGLVVLVALGTGRQRQAIPALAAAVLGLVLVLVTPELARSAGFALSVTATAGLVALGPPLARRLGRWMPRWLAEAVAVPTAASLATAPLVAALSASVSLARRSIPRGQ